MQPTLQLVSDRGMTSERTDRRLRRARSTRRRRAARGGGRAYTPVSKMRALVDDERGAVTAEYAIVIMAAVAFAGLLVAIMRSSEIRAMLVQLVENALGTAS